MSRSAQLRGQVIELTASFYDAADEYADPSNLKVSIYPPGKNPESGSVTITDAWVYDITLTDPGLGPEASAEVVERLSEGNYRYKFTVPADANLGAAYDKWEGTVDLQDLDETFAFVIVGGGSVGITQIYENNVVFIQLDKTVAASDGSTLATSYKTYFTTSYLPLYSAVRRVRLDLGSLIDNIPDDTINLAIFEASLEANALSFGTITQNVSFFQFARKQYVTCLAEVTLLTGMGGGKGGGGKSKRLADLAVTYQGNIDDLLKKALACMARWESVLTSSGALSPFVSQRPEYAIKGNYDPDRPNPGRLWEPTSSYLGADVSMPAANIKSKYSTNRRYKRDFSWPNRWRGSSGTKRWKDD